MPEPTYPYRILEMGPLKAWQGKSYARDLLGLSGSQVSFNRFEAGESTPFVHAHRAHEELYVILQGGGLFYLDGEEFPIKEGTMLRVNPQVKRAWKAGPHGITFICIQTKAGGLPEPDNDWIRLSDALPSWAQP